MDIVLFCSFQKTPSSPLPTLEGLFELTLRPSRALNLAFYTAVRTTETQGRCCKSVNLQGHHQLWKSKQNRILLVITPVEQFVTQIPMLPLVTVRRQELIQPVVQSKEVKVPTAVGTDDLGLVVRTGLQ